MTILHGKYSENSLLMADLLINLSKLHTVTCDINSSCSSSCDISLKNRFYGNQVDTGDFKSSLIQRLLPLIQKNKQDVDTPNLLVPSLTKYDKVLSLS